MLVWLAPLIVFGLVVFVHELGHFLAAKATGVYAPRFSIGFGPALWRKRWGETEYQLAALPLGGFVRMASREDEEIAFLEGGSEMPRAGRAGTVHEVGANDAPALVTPREEAPRPKNWDPEAMAPFGPKPVPRDRFFESKPLLARLFILIAGVTMNAILALVVSIGVFAHYGRPYVPAVVDSVVAGEPAGKAGLQRGDSVVAINGRGVRTWNDVIEQIAPSAGKDLAFDVTRAGGRQTIHITPAPYVGPDPMTGIPHQIGRIGAAPRPTIARDRIGFGEAVTSGWSNTALMAGSVAGVVRGLVTRQVSASNLGGPIAIGKASVDAARNGAESFLMLLAFLSINIAVLNLLPIPILDGGQVLLQLLEAAKGSPFSDRTREYILRAGLAAILLLFVVVMWNDITRLFS